MNIVFTLCSNNYLSQAFALGQSVRTYQAGWHFIIGLVDKKKQNIPYYKFDAEVIELHLIEPEMEHLAEKYSIIELNTVVKPTFFKYLFNERDAQKVIYMDPDTFLFSAMEEVEFALDENDFVLTPHVLTPVPDDDHTPSEPLFLNYGLYNLGFLALKRTFQTTLFLNWWKERIYSKGYNQPAKGLFVDQLWINLVPLYFERIYTMRHKGYNMAPWNLHERFLSLNENVILVNDNEPLVFYHFSSITPRISQDAERLHREFNRFEWEQRPDLWTIYREYRVKLTENLFDLVSKVPCYYMEYRSKFLDAAQQKARLLATAKERRDPILKKIIRGLKKALPTRIKNMAHEFIKA